MRSIILFLKSLKASLRQSPVICSAFAIFYIFSTIISIYVFGKYVNSLVSYDEYDDSLTRFTVECSKKYSVISDTVQKISSDKNVEYIRLFFSEDPENFQRDFTNGINPPIYAVSYAHGELEAVKDFFDEIRLNNLDIKDFIESDNKAIIVENAYSEKESDIKIQGIPHKIVERLAWYRNGVGNHFLSFKSVLKNNFYISYLEIKYYSIYNAQQLDEINKGLENDFSGMAVSKPILRDYNRESILSMGNILVYLVIILSAVNFIYIFKHILEKRRRQNEIFAICGCSKTKIVMFAFAEIFFVSAVLSLAGILLFKFVAVTLIISLEPLLKYTFTHELYLAVFGISVLLSFAILAIEFIFVQNRRLNK